MADHQESPEIVDYEDDNSQMYQQELVVPATLISMAESFEKKGHSWFVVSQLPSDLSIKLDDITFHVHKYPLVSRCGYLQQIDLKTSMSNDGYQLELQNFPGGAETFEIVVKFCYGLRVPLNPRNVARLRCAAEFLDMTEELEDGNLISKTESFLTFVIFSSWKDSITVLKSCKNLFPWAENLQILRRCCDSIAWASQETAIEQRRWINGVATLQIDHFKRIITSMTVKGLRPDFLGSCIMIYAEKRLLGNDMEIEGLKHHTNGKNELIWSIYHGRKMEKESGGQNQEQRIVIETLVSILPHQKDAVSCRFLLWMLKMAMVYSVSPALVSELERRVGMIMETASVYDLLIPAEVNQVKSLGEQTMYNVDSVLRILEYYLMNEQLKPTGTNVKSNISRLLDNYLAEIAGDPNLSATKFQVISESLPETARPCDDGLYRAIDIYLKAHPAISDLDRRRLCRVMDCRKLSVDACSHAAQNDRLPVRTVLQVLFAEQVKLRETIQKKQQTTNTDNSEQEDNRSSQKDEIKMLKAEFQKMMVLIEKLQTGHTNLQQDCKTISTKQNALSGWILGWNKFKKTSLFHSKVNGNENREGKGENKISSMLKPKRRQSMG